MRRFAMGAALVFALVAAMPAAEALTPTQSTAAATKAKADLVARNKAQAAAKAKADAATKARVDATTKTKAKFQTLLNVRAETNRRIEAATKAAEANAQVTSFRATSSPSPPSVPHKPGSEPGKLAVGAHHPDGDHAHHHADGGHDHHSGAAAEHGANAGSGHAH